MLVLSRRIGERIVIGDNIVITVVSQKGSGVRIGIEGPPDIPVHREEVYQRIRREERAASPFAEFELADAAR